MILLKIRTQVLQFLVCGLLDAETQTSHFVTGNSSQMDGKGTGIAVDFPEKQDSKGNLMMVTICTNRILL